MFNHRRVDGQGLTVQGYELRNVFDLVRPLALGDSVAVELYGQERIVIIANRPSATTLTASFVDIFGNTYGAWLLANQSYSYTVLDNTVYRYLRIVATVAQPSLSLQIKLYYPNKTLKRIIL